MFSAKTVATECLYQMSWACELEITPNKSTTEANIKYREDKTGLCSYYGTITSTFCQQEQFNFVSYNAQHFRQ